MTEVLVEAKKSLPTVANDLVDGFFFVLTSIVSSPLVSFPEYSFNQFSLIPYLKLA